jgi:hypothetical protein
VTVAAHVVVQVPDVIVAVFSTVEVSPGATVASKPTLAECPEARSTVMTSVEPVTVTAQVSVVPTVVQVGVPESVSVEGTGTVTVAAPPALPVFETVTV